MPYKDPQKQRAAMRAWRDHPDRRQADRIRKGIDRHLKLKPVSLDPSARSGKVPSAHERQVIEFFERAQAEDPEHFKEVFERYPALTAKELKTREEQERGYVEGVPDEDGLPAGTVLEAELLARLDPEGWARKNRRLYSQYGLGEADESAVGTDDNDHHEQEESTDV